MLLITVTLLVMHLSDNCPCATHAGPNSPAFVGNDYYHESGNSGASNNYPYYFSYPLWDGKGCDYLILRNLRNLLRN